MIISNKLLIINQPILLCFKNQCKEHIIKMHKKQSKKVTSNLKYYSDQNIE